MAHYQQLTFTESVKAAQERYGARAAAARMEDRVSEDERFSAREATWIAARDSFYMATVTESGWPYVQFRGGPAGFLKVLDAQTLGYADFRGNRQLLSTGNMAHDPRVSLILLDYPTQTRLKILARAEVVSAEDDPELVAKLEDPSYRARVERAVVFRLEAFDWNCPQHITPRYTEAEWAARQV